MSVKSTIWIQCHKSVLGAVYGELVRQHGVIQRQTEGGELCSILVRVPHATQVALETAVKKIHGSVLITPD